MKVVGTGSPAVLTIRVKPCEVHVLHDVVSDRRDAALELAGTRAARRRAHEDDRGGKAMPHALELRLLNGLLDALRVDQPDVGNRLLVGPTWLLDPIVRDAAAEAVERLSTAVDMFRAGTGKLMAEQVRAAVDAAGACTATLIGLDHAQSHGVE